MLSLIRFLFFIGMMAALWVFQPTILSQMNPEERQEIAERPKPQVLQGAHYQIEAEGTLWDLYTDKALFDQQGLTLEHPQARAQTGKFFEAAQAYWSFDQNKIFFSGGIKLFDPENNLEMQAPTASYDVAQKELIFDTALTGQYRG